MSSANSVPEQDGWGEVQVSDGWISYLARGRPGQGLPLVLLPSLGGGAAGWGELGARLAAERFTLALDPRGFGRSSPPASRLSTRGMAQEMLAALDALNVPRCDLFGISLGSLIASWLAILAPRRVGHLVLASCAARGTDYVPRRPALAWRLLRDALTKPNPRPALARDVATRSESKAAQRAEAGAARGAWSRRRLLHFLNAVARHDVRAELARLRAPTLLLHGELDAILGREAQATLLAGIPHARLFELAGAGHNLVEEAAEPSARSILEFLRTQGA